LSRIWLSKVRLLYRPKQYAANPPLRRIHCIPPTATSPIGSSINVWIEAQKTGYGPSFFARMTKAPPKSKKTFAACRATARRGHSCCRSGCARRNKAIRQAGQSAHHHVGDEGWPKQHSSLSEEKVMKRMVLALALAATVISGSVAVAGAIGGPAFALREYIYGYQTIDYRVAFRGGEWAKVGVVGTNSSNLDLFIYDEFGNLVAYDVTYIDNYCEVTFYVTYPQVYTLRVVNRGANVNLFDIATN
jgi:hypothetical protein